jgi:hypothetical protein
MHNAIAQMRDSRSRDDPVDVQLDVLTSEVIEQSNAAA